MINKIEDTVDFLLSTLEENIDELKEVNPSLAEKVDNILKTTTGTLLTIAALISCPIVKVLIYFNKKSDPLGLRNIEYANEIDED